MFQRREDREADLFKCCRTWTSHLHLSVPIPSNTPPFYFLIFQIWDWSIPIINLVSVGFGAFSSHGKSPKFPGQYTGVCRIRIFSPAPSVWWQSEFLFGGKIFCISGHILYPCVDTQWKTLKSTLQCNPVLSVLWGNYHNWNLSVISIISNGCYQNVFDAVSEKHWMLLSWWHRGDPNPMSCATSTMVTRSMCFISISV